MDARLHAAARAAERIFAVRPGEDPYRGLYSDAADVARLLARTPGDPSFALAEPLAGVDEAALAVPALAALADQHALDAFDLATLLIALAPELDLRYERLYGFLHDDVTRRRPTVGLTLDLLCATTAERFERRRRFDGGAPLVRGRLVHVDPPGGDGPPPPRLAHVVRVDPLVVARVTGDDSLDERLTRHGAVLTPPSPVPAPEGTAIEAVAERARAAPLAVYVEGRPGSGRATVARALAFALERPLVEVDLARLARAGDDTADLVRLATDEARARDAVTLLRNLDALEDAARDDVLRAVAAHAGVTAMTGASAWPPDAPLVALSLRVDLPAAGARRDQWGRALSDRGLSVPTEDVDALGDRFRLTPAQIARAAADAAMRTTPGGDLPPAEVFAAARRSSRAGLGAMARRVESELGWDALVLPADRLAQLREAAAYLRHGARVFDDWGFARRLDCSRGLTMLFTGASGTGKTTAAKVLANDLGLDLYRVDLSAVVDKYIGETEKNLARVFDAAEAGNAILFFDEADALFGKRSEVRDSHDRYANLETSFLLQRMEEYEGLAILATNLAKHLDQAFARRIQATVEFPLPGEEERRAIWRGIWPDAVKLARDVDLDMLAERFELSGGSIRNAALAAAFLAADDDRAIGRRHLLAATRAEYRKLGNVTLPSGLGATPNGAVR